ncbi:MAG: hypothetical protein APR56_13655 [Methanosaeta sp. SDB]|nr:MAG: hypothetical protein APR56_13655 [Methanosaeta sp. SDB]
MNIFGDMGSELVPEGPIQHRWEERVQLLCCSDLAPGGWDAYSTERKEDLRDCVGADGKGRW